MRDVPQPDANREVAARLNKACFCVTLDLPSLETSLRDEIGDEAFAALIGQRQHLFAEAPVFLPSADMRAMQRVVAAIEAAAQRPDYQTAVLGWAPKIATLDFGPHGAFMGYDFHVGESGPKLIEVNTNAGGAFFNALLGRAQSACCAPVERALALEALGAFEPAAIAMFEAEWRAQGRTHPLRRIAIVDDAPLEQYLYPEFLIAKRLLERAGNEAAIVDAKDLAFVSGELRAQNRPIDLVYNRLVDFALDQPAHAALRDAYSAGAVVVTPNPRNHALLADKRNLTLLSDEMQMRAWGLAPSHIEALSSLPHAVRVSAANADDLWAARKRYFFKPAAGHASKAVYRGDKLTKSAWETVLAGDYIAQQFAPPSERTIRIDGAEVQRKLDVRLYTYDGAPLLAAARLYQGQTTNFRTEGGGFAPVFFV
ncbi:MAG: hypothetical protein HY054_10615 [Proteobacteria bacterium]|nr:hypothetical protein [Pseudomonadota bacterium]